MADPVFLKSIIKFEKKIITLEEKDPKNPKQEKKILRKIEKLQKTIDQTLGKKMIKDLDKNYKKDKINEAAYQIIKNDLEWMLIH